MKIALMSGAYANAGDFLIEERCKLLLEANIKKTQIDILKRNISYDDKTDLLNSYDLIVFGGGPGFQKNLYPDKVPFVSDLDALKVPVSIMGWGWKGRNTNLQTIYKKYRFSPKMLDFIRYIDHNGIPISCRDWNTVQVLRKYGINSLQMTGCPAWYDLRYINDLHVKAASPIKKICISDAAYADNLHLMNTVIEFVRSAFPFADIKLILHRGIHKRNRFLTMKDFVSQYQMSYADIAGSVTGFSQYDDCDLHIGFRVHAHIYNLSRGNRSILINEDARGSGVNDALGIRNIWINHPFITKSNRKDYLQRQLSDYLHFLTNTNFQQYETACQILCKYYVAMQKYIKSIGDLC